MTCLPVKLPGDDLAEVGPVLVPTEADEGMLGYRSAIEGLKLMRQGSGRVPIRSPGR